MPKRDPAQENELMDWIFTVVGEKRPPGALEDVLKDGIVLCNLINKLKPGSVKKINQNPKGQFQLMENVQRFQEAVKKYGLPQQEIFQTVDLTERRNVQQVILSLYALGRLTQKDPDFKGPHLGPKMADENKREFSEEEIRKMRDADIGLQAGYNKGASQAGLGGMGNLRHM